MVFCGDWSSSKAREKKFFTCLGGWPITINLRCNIECNENTREPCRAFLEHLLVSSESGTQSSSGVPSKSESETQSCPGVPFSSESETQSSSGVPSSSESESESDKQLSDGVAAWTNIQPHQPLNIKHSQRSVMAIHNQRVFSSLGLKNGSGWSGMMRRNPLSVTHVARTVTINKTNMEECYSCF